MTAERTKHPVEIFDVTIRDGSYAVDFQFNADDVRFLYPILEKIGFRYIEVGHGFGLDASKVKGPAAATDDAYLAAAAESRKSSKFGTFFIPGIGDRDSLRRAREHGMDFIRIGSDATKIERIVDSVAYAKELGYEVMCNFMKSYVISPAELARKARVLETHGAEVVYVVDSAGGMLPKEVEEYFRALAGETGARTGFHAHNNLELSVANCIRAMERGCTLLDCSIGGLGRSAGNTRTELLIPVLKALHVETHYDFLEVLRVWDHVIAPIMRRRELGPTELVGGYALVHSELMAPYKKVADALGLRLDALLEAFGTATRVEHREVTAEAVGQSLAADPRARRLAAPRPSALFEIGKEQQDAHHIRNTFRGIGEVFSAAQTLASKAYIPIAAVATIDHYPPDDAYVTAEYLYHDDHFVFLGLLCSSVEVFVKTMKEHGAKLDTLVFDRVAPAHRRELDASSDGRGALRVYSLDLARVRAQHLLSVLHQVARDSGSARVLFFGGAPERLAPHLPRELETTSCFKALARPYAGLDVAPEPLFRTARGHASADGPFDVLVVLSRVDGAELDALSARLAPRAVIIDCSGTVGPQSPALEGRGHSVISLSLARSYTGELMKLRTLENLDAFVRPAFAGARQGDRS